jgi:heme-degrading monooxygenase HmoA
MKNHYAIMWEFHVKKEHQNEFEEIYGPVGEWVQLFKKSPGYIRTDLARRASDKFSYVIIDVWETKKAYDEFCHNWGKDYKQLDEKCDSFTEKEIPLGTFELFIEGKLFDRQ